MLTEEIHSAGVADKITEHEEAAHDKRNWVRLTFDCNNRCIFCLDSDSHDGEYRNRDEIKQQILDGRRKGATRLILSGGEPTIHPNYIDFIKLGARAGYRKVQTVTNGRLFMYKEFLDRCLDAGLGEITFSVHGPNARIHDALVGVKGAYEEEMEGLRNVLADGRPIVNIDVVINRGNVKHLPQMLKMYIEMGVREFDLLQVVPFGRAFTEGKDTLFYDLEEMRPYLLEAFAYSKLPDMHIWLNRFPPQHLEGYEHLIQDPYKLNDEVRGRKEEYARLLDEGTNLDCREPQRCKYCYLERLCDTLDEVRATAVEQTFEAVRVDTEWEAGLGPVFGGDPASARRAKAEAEAAERVALAASPDGKTRLPMLAASAAAKVPAVLLTVDELVAGAGAKTLWIVAPDVARARPQIERFAAVDTLDLELADYTGLETAMSADGVLFGRRVERVRTNDATVAQALLAMPHTFEVLLSLRKQSEPWLLGLDAAPARLALLQPSHERLTESASDDVDLRAFFGAFTHAVPVEGVPACVLGRLPRTRPETLDTSMMTPEGRLEIFRYTRRYILQHYRTKSLRCGTCAYNAGCDGMHVNYVRAHGYGLMQPVGSDAE